jgi:hypothetical protein
VGQGPEVAASYNATMISTRTAVRDGLFAVGVVIALVSCGPAGADDSRGATYGGNATSVADTGEHGACGRALDYAKAASVDYRVAKYESGYADANHALQLAPKCSSPTREIVKGVALSARAWNEHHLTQGNSRADLRQGEVILGLCILLRAENSRERDLQEVCRLTHQANMLISADW